MLLLGLFGVLGLLIAAVGVYGVMAYLVSQRTREIGVRMALGATRTQVMRMVVRQAGALAAIGVALGGVVAWTFTGAVQSFLFGLQPNDARAFTIAAVTLLARRSSPARSRRGEPRAWIRRCVERGVSDRSRR